MTSPALPPEVEAAITEVAQLAYNQGWVEARRYEDPVNTPAGSKETDEYWRMQNTLRAAIGKALEQAKAQEREACLEAIENATESDVDPHRTAEVDEEAVWKACAAVIRARGKEAT